MTDLLIELDNKNKLSGYGSYEDLKNQAIDFLEQSINNETLCLMHWANLFNILCDPRLINNDDIDSLEIELKSTINNTKFESIFISFMKSIRYYRGDYNIKFTNIEKENSFLKYIDPPKIHKNYAHHLLIAPNEWKAKSWME